MTVAQFLIYIVFNGHIIVCGVGIYIAFCGNVDTKCDIYDNSCIFISQGIDIAERKCEEKMRKRGVGR